MVTPPSSLTAARLRNPHRSTQSRNHGTLSVLEHSFAIGNLDEIEYWIDSGVVAEALGGKARSRRVYTKSLMDFFARSGLWRATHDNKQRGRMQRVAEVLWEGGAQQHTERYEHWLHAFMALPFADILMDHGANPWTRTDEGYLRNTISSVCHAMYQVWANLRIPGSSQNQNDDLHEGLRELVERIDRCLDHPGHCPEALNEALAQVMTGMLQRGYTHKTDQRWRGWRERLLALGASAVFNEHDALRLLVRSAPHNPIRLADILDEQWRLRAAKREALKALEPPDSYRYIETPELTPEENRKLAEQARDRRAMRWIKLAHEWLDALTPSLSQERTAEEIRAVGMERSHWPQGWASLMDCPGGVEVGERLVSLLSQHGQPLPWHSDPGFSRDANECLSMITTVDQQRSVRKMDVLLRWLACDQSKQSGIHPAWRISMASAWLGRSPGLEEDTRIPGMELDLNEGPGRRVGWVRAPQDDMFLPSPREMDQALQLAGPRVIVPDTGKEIHWIQAVLRALPRLWAEHGTPPEQRRDLLDVMDRHDALGGVMPEMVLLAQSQGLEDEAQENVQVINTILGKWFAGWTQDLASQAILIEALEQGQTHRRHLGRALRRLSQWTQLMGVGKEFDQVMATPTQGTPLIQELAMDPDARALFGRMVKARLVQKDYHDTRNTLLCVRGLYQVVVAGWKPDDSDAICQALIDGLPKHKVPRPMEQELIKALVNAIVPNPREFYVRLMDNLMRADRLSSSPKKDWSHLVGLLSDDGYTFNIPLPQRTPNSLAQAVGMAHDRVELSKMAAGARNTGGSGMRRM